MFPSRHTRARPQATRSPLTRVATLAAAGVAGSLLICAPSVSAHNVLVDTDPGDGSTVDTQPGTVELIYDQFVQDQFTQVAVLDEDENPHHVGEPEVDYNTVTQDVQDLPDGEYTVSYRVISADGHPVSGTFSFTMAAGDPAEEVDEETTNDDDTAADDETGDGETGDGEAASESEGGISPLVAAVVVLAVVVTGAAVYFVTRRRGRGATSGPDGNGDAPDSQRD